MTRKLEDDLRINDPLEDEFGIRNSEFGDADEIDELCHPEWSGEATESKDLSERGIRPMEPLQPSSKTKKKSALRRSSGTSVAEQPSSSRPSKRGGNPGQQSIEELEKQMKEAAARLDFEEAARLRDIIRAMK